jgi:serum/glucocorticoid-regulated kinase 2
MVVSVRIKRRIPLNKILGMTLSRFGIQFIIHVPTEYDYLMQSADFNEKIVETLCFSFYHFNQMKLAFFYRVNKNSSLPF